MRIIKRLYLFVLKSFLPQFAMTFFIVLFIVLMQFLWKYIDDLVGKGLSMGVMGELFFYAAVSMVPMALPLAILLASLMTFGNLGEKFELTAMKASGISLLKVMRPLIIFIGFVAVGAFFFQNDVLPKAQVKMWTLLFSMRQKSPELEIPEGVFYDQIPGYNLYVSHKNRETGMLYDAMIYDVNAGNNSTILRADSAQLAMTPDMRYLYLHLYTGEQFENLREQTSSDRNVPFRRESFFDKQILIPFDANFNRLDEEGMRKQYVGKNIDELNHTIDSISTRVDSIAVFNTANLRYDAFPILRIETAPRHTYGNYAPVGEAPYPDTRQPATSQAAQTSASRTQSPARPAAPREVKAAPVDINALVASLTPSQQGSLFSTAHGYSQRRKAEIEFSAQEISGEKKSIRRHGIELLKKFTLSVACMIFFFIGAPLGAIIRKGGLGTPLVISVLLFLVYYIIDNTGYKMARDGHIAVWAGMWLSTFILAPLSIFVTYKAMNDSAVFDKDRYINFFRKLFGISMPRSVAYKEVIINDISLPVALDRLDALSDRCRTLLTRCPQRQSYVNYWLEGYPSARIRVLGRLLDRDVNYLSDCRDLKVIDLLGEYPVIDYKWLYRPAKQKWLGISMMVLFPIGITVWLIGLHSQLMLRRSLRKTIAVSDKISAQLTTDDPEAEAPYDASGECELDKFV